ncbi:MAG TPA: hypothetical protein DER05_05060 [Lutibacter sp.]|nr:hypothetical protein [Lutibacter sp.]
MKLVNNKTPFKIILDAFKKDSYNVYTVVKSLFNYPSISQVDDYNLEGKLYASAFAYLCNEYLTEQVSIPKYNDFNYFFFQMCFQANEISIIALEEKYNLKRPKTKQEYIDNTYQLIQIYKAKIITDLKTQFPTEKSILRLFAAIFKFDEKPVFDYFKSNNFYKNNFEKIISAEDKKLTTCNTEPVQVNNKKTSP